MFATRDQENLIHGHQQVAASKPLNQSTRSLQPKTPGNRYPKTPLKIPLHDENAPAGFGAKSGRGKGLENLGTGKMATTVDKGAFVTPMGPRTRAPLGMKTTNAKTKAIQTPAGPAFEKGLEKSQAPKTSARRPKKVVHADTVKLQIHGDESPLTERDVEYAPPKPKDLPYESDVFPDGCLNYDAVRPGNLMRGMYRTYHCEVDEQGRTSQDREYEEEYQKSAKATDERILRMMKEEWTVGDVPETFRHLRKKVSPTPVVAPAKKNGIEASGGPPTITSRRAATALSVAPKPTASHSRTSKPVTQPAVKSAIPFLTRSRQPTAAPQSSSSLTSHIAATAASRSTIGYSKGRSAINALQKREGGLTRSTSNLSQGSDTTITPARFAEQESDDLRRFDFLRAFDTAEDELEPRLGGGAVPDYLKDDEDDEFILTLGS